MMTRNFEAKFLQQYPQLWYTHCLVFLSCLLTVQTLFSYLIVCGRNFMTNIYSNKTRRLTEQNVTKYDHGILTFFYIVRHSIPLFSDHNLASIHTAFLMKKNFTYKIVTAVSTDNKKQEHCTCINSEGTGCKNLASKLLVIVAKTTKHCRGQFFGTHCISLYVCAWARCRPDQVSKSPQACILLG